MYSPLNLFGYWTLNKHYYFHKSVLELLLTTYNWISRTAASMILGSATATCLAYLDCTDHETTDVWCVDNARSNRHLHEDLNYTIRYIQNVKK